MKTLHTLLAAAALLTLTTTTSCDNGDEPGPQTLVVDFNFDNSIFTDEGYWSQVYNPQVNNFGLEPGIVFTHHADVTEWDGIKYYSFTGFCPSRAHDTEDYTGGDWTQHQWSAIAPGTGDLVIAHWNTQETSATPILERSCAIGFSTTVTPGTFWIANTTWAYYAMLNGSAFSKPFGAADSMTLHVHGVLNGKDNGKTVDVALAKNGHIEDQWIQADLSALGQVDAMYFTMTSTDSGQWGMNTPAYFAMRRMTLSTL